MKNYRLSVVALFCLISACKNHEQKTTVVETQEKKDFFPVADYISSEIGYVDSLPLKMTKYITQNGKKDSSLIKLQEFDDIAHEFLPAEISDSIFQKNFEENSFFDQTTQSLTFTYSTKNSKLALQRVDVIANRTSGYDKVRSVYMEKTTTKNDTVVLKKMYWRAKKSLEIITILQPPDQSKLPDHLKVVWDIGE